MQTFLEIGYTTGRRSGRREKKKYSTEKTKKQLDIFAICEYDYSSLQKKDYFKLRNASLSRDIERIGSINNSVKFGIDTNNARAFKVLSSTLYKDKILACCREYSCNARDSHLMAGKGGEPFYVHLPNSLEPFFSVRDNGLGLSDDDVQTIWTNYFVSTKNSDDVSDKSKPTGTLGLGSKSGFAYVDSFTLISRYGGVKATYTSFINESGCPEIVRMGDPTETDEGNGVEVIIPVDKAQDFREFERCARQVYELFDPMPIVTGVAQFSPRVNKTIISGKGWRLREEDNYGYQLPRAIMGSLAYPISAGSIQNVGGNVRRLLNAPFDIDFELDTLDFTAGREELSYDQTITQPALRERLTVVYDELVEMVKSEFASCETEYAARKKYAAYFNTANRYNNPLSQVLSGSVKWRDKVLNNDNITIGLADFSKEFYREELYFVDSYSRTYGKSVARIRRVLTKGSHNQLHFPTHDRNVPVILDMQTNFMPRLRYYLSQNANKHIHLISGTDEDIALFREKLAGCEFLLASELPKPPNMTVRRKTHIRKLGPDNYRKSSMSYDWMISDDIDIADGGTYVVLSKGKVIGFEDSEEFFELIKIARDVGVVKGDVFVITPSLLKSLEDKPNWSNINDLIKQRVETTLQNDPDAAKAFAAGGIIESMRAHNFFDFAGRIPDILLTDVGDHEIATAVRGFRSILSVSKNTKLSHIVSLADHFNLTSNVVQSRDIVAEFRAIKEKYPLLLVVFDHNHLHYSPTTLYIPAIEYIRLVDNMPKDIAKIA